MCGIAAIAGKNIDTQCYSTDSMLRELSHRGPDGFGNILLKNCWLGHSRLAILDLESGNQPMQDGELTISFNGEIYNNLELRAELRENGYFFHTQSDTETILKAYRMWGTECPKHLDGIFALVIWDNKKDEMFIARDRLGQKPLFYFFDEGNILIASEIKSLIASSVLEPKIDFGAIDNYLRLMYIPPWKSVYGNVHQIPPAHCGVFKNGKLNLKRYWLLKYKPINVPYDKAKARVRELLSNAVKKRLANSDVEIGFFLSGGLDSSLVTLLAAEEIDSKFKAFSISYGGHDELPFAREVADKIGAKHFVKHIDQLSTIDLEKTIKYFDEPHADTSDFSQHLLSEMASRHVKVVLSGDGADEFFLGYKWHIDNRVNILSEKNSSNVFLDRINSICPFSSEQRKSLWQSSLNIDDSSFIDEFDEKSIDPMSRVTLFDMACHLPGQILTKIDRAGMMHGLEVRSPFLDIDLIEYVFNLPYKYKVHDGVQKYILKDILSEFMPKDFVYRRKQGFGAPIDQWLINPQVKAEVCKKLGKGSSIRSFLSGEDIDIYLSDFYASETKPQRAAQRVWVLLCLEYWITQAKLSL